MINQRRSPTIDPAAVTKALAPPPGLPNRHGGWLGRDRPFPPLLAAPPPLPRSGLWEADGVTTSPADEFEVHRPRLFGLAYRLLGSAADAEDAVQDAYLRFSEADRPGIARPGAWLAKVVTNLCLNRLTSARARRERYPGSWLPEPVVTADGTLGPLESAEQRDAVSLALLLLLERLTPTERAVYVLREAFAYGHREIAGVLELSETNCRQLYRRAVQQIAAPEARFQPPPDQQAKLVASFLTAAREGDLAGLERLFAAEVVWWSDGGGKVSAARRPVEGRDKVLRLLAGLLGRSAADGVRLSVVEVNGGAGLVARGPGGADEGSPAGSAAGPLIGVVAFEVRDGVFTGVRAVLNPDKLEFVGRQLATVRDGS
ncbi:RNA polymerase sigma factor SigJ [Streptomyces sp. NPDC093509]|uniref:RNA polymerase sigma factor SigJ n=1 Tax=Streptomyces sp. NPDC093509 TaxID=3154982 RepID=UPI00344E5730